ncbi:glycosyltransferase [Arthrobacter oryzae]|uniref:glycosyltransferase n=1 Tax=Arthrobacter oryzae TaxID=409290 RepID=UPI00273CCAF9|nr:glycosyltransferase [Arthrobacter oryzae]WLQ07120.1 glycosyltransferase [Arthrobacter oryzae]
MEKGLRILHVTEAMAGGIATVLQSFSERQRDAGADVSIYYLSRPESPSTNELQARFGNNASLRNFTGGRSKLRDYFALAVALANAENSGDFDVIHLHSSKAGVIGRTIHLFTRRRAKLFYSPHGFAFLREDVSRGTRQSIKLIETALAPIGSGLVLTCESERRIAEEDLRSKSAYVVTTGVNEKSLAPACEGTTSSAATAKLPYVERPKVGIVARVTYQKAPWRFKAVADSLSAQADFIWIGGGTPDKEKLWLGEHKPTGWLSPTELADAMKELDIFLFPTLWEGMPLALLQAQAAGIPAVVSNVVGNCDAIADGETGYICNSDEEIIKRTRQLIADSELRRRMSKASRERALQCLTDRDLGTQSLAIYATSKKTK